MTDQFVPYEVALKLKEKGFDETCLAFYTNEGVLYSEGWGYKKNNNVYETETLAPLYQQVFKWFREKHMKSSRFNIDTNGWYFTIAQFTESGSSLTDSRLAPLAKQDYKTYEEAELACINKMLELI